MRSDHCPDCGVLPALAHDDGCDVARCTVCGFQRISCEHESSNEGWGQIWTGRWPGDAEVEEGLASDLNDLHSQAQQGFVKWDGQRWRKHA